MADGNTMLTCLLKGVWRDTATVTLGLVLMFAIAAADGAHALTVIGSLPFHVDPQAVDLVVGGIFAVAVEGGGQLSLWTGAEPKSAGRWERKSR